jgi:hypothetical protein
VQLPAAAQCSWLCLPASPLQCLVFYRGSHLFFLFLSISLFLFPLIFFTLFLYFLSLHFVYNSLLLCLPAVWLLYEYPETRFEGMSMRFMDMRKRVYEFPELGKTASLVCIPTTSGTGGRVGREGGWSVGEEEGGARCRWGEGMKKGEGQGCVLCVSGVCVWGGVRECRGGGWVADAMLLACYHPYSLHTMSLTLT